jgi:hypothetical protein
MSFRLADPCRRHDDLMLLDPVWSTIIQAGRREMRRGMVIGADGRLRFWSVEWAGRSLVKKLLAGTISRGLQAAVTTA